MILFAYLDVKKIRVIIFEFFVSRAQGPYLQSSRSKQKLKSKEILKFRSVEEQYKTEGISGKKFIKPISAI